MAINQKQPGDYGFVAFYKGKRYEVYGPTTLKARDLVQAHVKAKKPWDINITVAERPDGSTVEHTATD
jgi:hypothetical protein